MGLDLSKNVETLEEGYIVLLATEKVGIWSVNDHVIRFQAKIIMLRMDVGCSVVL